MRKFKILLVKLALGCMVGGIVAAFLALIAGLWWLDHVRIVL